MHSERTPSRRVYGYPCSIFSGLRTAPPWDYFYTVYPYSHPSTYAFTRIHTRTPTKYRKYSPETIEAHFGFFRDFLYN